MAINITRSDPGPRPVVIPSDVYATLTRNGSTIGGVKDAIAKLQKIVDTTPEPQPTYSINGLSKEDLYFLRAVVKFGMSNHRHAILTALETVVGDQS